MEPVTLITTAIALATPYLMKTGEKIAEDIGEDIWKIIKRVFTKGDKPNFSIDLNNQIEKENLILALSKELKKDNLFKDELENAVIQGQKNLSAYYQQNINNNAQIDKQINIQDNSGNIQM